MNNRKKTQEYAHHWIGCPAQVKNKNEEEDDDDDEEIRTSEQQATRVCYN